MPCYRCGTRQTDPERGPSPWKRGVVKRGADERGGAEEHQVLVCPACQSQPQWAAEFQSCARCGSLHLIRRLDQVECLDCRLVREVSPEAPPAAASSGDLSLAEEVARALRRVLGPA
jgi:hypothetical protein